MRKMLFFMIALILLTAPASATYAKSQTFHFSSSADLTDYQEKFILSNASGNTAGNVIYTNGSTQSAWQDIKFNWTFNGVDQSINCPYWLETKNQTASTITVYVRVPYIYANSTSGLKFFYNDSSATSNSNGSATFPFFDDFTASGLNSTWVQNGTGTVTAGGGTCTILGGDIHIRSSTASFGTNQMLLTRLQTNKWGSTTGLIQGGFNYYGGSDSNENYYTQVNFAHISSSLTRTIAQATGGSSTYTQVATGAWSNTSYHRLELIRTDSSSILYTDDTYRSTLTGYYPTVALYPYYRCYYGNDSVVIDYVAVRQYTATAPTVIVAPVAAFTASTTSGSIPLTVQFTDTSLNSATSWYWDFGDGAGSTAQNPTHTYTVSGTYTVYLAVGNAAGSDAITHTGYISALGQTPVASFNVTRVAAKTVQLNDTSTNLPTSWLWDFGDGNTSTSQNVTYTFANYSTYNIKLTATNNGGSSTNTTPYYVNVIPPNNYTHYKDVLFTQNMTSWDFVSNLRTFYTSFMPEWFFWLIILTIPYIGMYNRQGGVEIIAVIYLFTGGIVALVMPAVLAPFAKWFLILGGAGMIYQLFVRD